MKLPMLSKAVGVIVANKAIVTAVSVSLLVAVPTTLYVSERQENTQEAAQKQNIEQIEQTEKSEVADTTEPLASSPDTPQATTNNQRTSTRPNTPTTPSTGGPQPATEPQPATPAPTPTPDPQYLLTCVYQGAPHNGENCPYNPPPAWSSSFTKYVCMNYYNMTACPSYRNMTQLIYGIDVEYHNNDIYVGYAGRCVFRTTAGDIQRVVFVSANEKTSGSVDCLTAKPI